MRADLPRCISEYRRLVARFRLERRSLRAKNLLDVGNCRILATLDMGYQVEIDARQAGELTRYLQPSPSALSITAISFLVLSRQADPISLLIGAGHQLHALNLLALHKRGRLHVIDPDLRAHQALERTLQINEGLFSQAIFHPIALGETEGSVEFSQKPLQLDCLVAIGGDESHFPWRAGRETPPVIKAQTAPLEEILSETELARAQLVILDARRHLRHILPGLSRFWRLNPLAHAIVRLTGGDEISWDRLMRGAISSGRRVWALPAGRLLSEAPRESRAVWITPMGL